MTETVATGRALVHPGAAIGAACSIAPMAIVEDGAVVGDGAILEPFSRVCSGARLGDGVRLGQGAVVGCPPQHHAWDGRPAPSSIGDGVRIGEYATISGGMTGPTLVGAGTLVMAYAHVGHDCVLGRKVVMANGVQLAGHVRVGDGANIGGGTLVHQRVRIGNLAFVAGGLRLELDLAPWSKAMGVPARWAGLNRIALAREGWDRERILCVESLLRTVFRRGLRLVESLERLDAVEGPDSGLLAAFCREVERGLLRPA